MAHTGLAVIESRWWRSGNDTVRPIFETLSGIVEDNPHSVRYDMFAEERSLRQIISNIAGDKEIKSIYIGAHGDKNAIGGLGGVSISRTMIRNMLTATNKSGSICGMYLGSCLVGTFDNSGFWFEQEKTGLSWIAGYSKSIDWIESSAIDMIFWSYYLRDRKLNRSRRRGKKSELKMVEDATSKLHDLMPAAFDKLGFNVYYKSATA